MEQRLRCQKEVKRRIKLTLFYNITVFYSPSTNPCPKPNADRCTMTVAMLPTSLLEKGQQNKEFKTRNRSSFLTQLGASTAQTSTQAANEWGGGDGCVGREQWRLNGSSCRSEPERPGHVSGTTATVKGLGSGPTGYCEGPRSVEPPATVKGHGQGTKSQRQQKEKIKTKKKTKKPRPEWTDTQEKW